MVRWVASLIALLVCSVASAEVVTLPIDYKIDGSGFQGALVFDNTLTGKRPGVLVAHEDGAMSYAGRYRAGFAARLGYIAFTVDLYGKGVNPGSAGQATQIAGLTVMDRSLARTRAKAALDTLLKQKEVDPKQIAGVGFGLGGTALLELARTGVDLEAVAMLHSPILPPAADEKVQIQSTFLVLAGDADPQLPAELLQGFEKGLKSANVECTVERFPGVAHDFTDPQAGRNVKSGSAYDQVAERKALEAVKNYLAEEIPLKAVKKEKLSAVRKDPTPAAPPAGVPAKVLAVLKYVDENLEAMEGYEGGRTFGNFEHRLAANDRTGRRIKYQEWDVNPLRPGVNRGVERMITGSDGSAYYTADHYETFKRIR